MFDCKHGRVDIGNWLLDVQFNLHTTQFITQYNTLENSILIISVLFRLVKLSHQLQTGMRKHEDMMGTDIGNIGISKRHYN